MDKILKILKANQDKEYRQFVVKLIPNIPSESILGVRKPVLRKLAKDITNGKIKISEKEKNEFLNTLPHKYHEENILHVYLLMEEHDKCILINRLDIFLPYIDNWETCDLLTLKPLLQDKTLLHDKCIEWINSDIPYIQRFAIVTQIKALKGGIDVELFNKVVGIKTSEYYVNMAIAWYLQEALLYDKRLVTEVLNSNVLPDKVLRFTVKKINESYRVDNSTKTLISSIKTIIK